MRVGLWEGFDEFDEEVGVFIEEDEGVGVVVDVCEALAGLVADVELSGRVVAGCVDVSY